MAKKLFGVRNTPLSADIALLVLRVVMGVAFILHGYGKIQNPFGWMDQSPTGAAPPVFQALAALSEFGGGMALILGLVTPLAALGILSTMVVALHLHIVKQGLPFAKFELPAVYFCITLVFLALGPGRLSLDRLLFGRR